MLKITPLFSSSKGNSIHIKSDSHEILVDAGVSYRRLKLALESIGTSPSNIGGIIVTHEHADHIGGIEMFCKANKIPIYINSESASYAFFNNKSKQYSNSCINILEPGQCVTVGDMTVSAFGTPHDSFGSVGYQIKTTKGDSFSIATDIGYISKGIANHLLGSQTVIIESNYDIEMLKNGSYPQSIKQRVMSNNGHLSNSDCSKFVPFLAKAGAKRIILAHLSAENNTPKLAYEASLDALKKAGFSDVLLEVAPRSILND